MENLKNLADLLGIFVEYKDKSMQTVCMKKYGLREHTSYISMMLKRTIMDVEDLVYQLQGGSSKEDWSDAAYSGFQQIRHKLLDRAGEIERIPDSIYVEYNDDGEVVLVDDKITRQNQEKGSISGFMKTLFEKRTPTI